MKAQEFCYWLQGLFELSHIDSLNEKQVTLIKRHLNMVQIHDPQGNSFYHFLNGFFTIQNPTVIEEAQTKIIKDELNKMFEHVVSPVPRKQKNTLPPGVEAMC